MKSKRSPQDWQHVLVLCLVIALMSGGSVFLFLHFDLIPYSYSVERGYIDNFLKILFSIAAVVFSIVIGVLGYSLIFFRRQKGDNSDGHPVRGFAPLERAWTVIPLIIVIGLAIYGAVVLDKMTAAGPPQTEMEVDVMAFRYGWQFTYPQFNITSYELNVPVNQRILIKLQSKDVVHSFWVQEWGPKQDAVPGITTQVRYTPTKIGQYTVQCSQLCGSGHTFMTAPAIVTSAGDFQDWVKLQQLANTTTTTTGVNNSATINLMAHNVMFDQNTITVTAGSDVTINFNNTDSQVPHNFALYASGSPTLGTAYGPVFVGQIITGPSTIVYHFMAPTSPGNYFFRCDVHPTMMTGTFVVK
jgi:cytochrome c oxidase subunit II